MYPQYCYTAAILWIHTLENYDRILYKNQRKHCHYFDCSVLHGITQQFPATPTIISSWLVFKFQQQSKAPMLPLTLLLVLLMPSSAEQCQPWGVRLSFGQFYSNTSQPNQLYVTFNTDQLCPDLTVQLNNHSYKCQAKPFSLLLEKPPVNYSTNIHRCAIYGLEFNDTDVLNLPYQIGTKAYNMRVISKFIKSKWKALVIGDWGLLDEQAKKIYYDVFPCLKKVIADQQIVMLLFLGDLAYELVDNNCQKYRDLLIALQPYTSLMPFSVNPGNHDTHRNSYKIFTDSWFSPYWQQYYNFFYWLQFGDVEIVAYNPEKQVYDEYQDKDMFEDGYPEHIHVLVPDLVKQYYESNKLDKNVNTRIVMSHYSMYCSNPEDAQCSVDGDAEHLQNYHSIFQNHGVVLSLGAHIHLYERSFPIALDGTLGNYKNLSRSESHVIYKNPDSITFISQGAGGNTYFVNRDPYPKKYFTGAEIQNTGYGILQLMNGMNITYKHYTALNCSVVDYMQIFRESQGILGIKNSQMAVVIALSVLAGALFVVCVLCLVRRRMLAHRLRREEKGAEVQVEKFQEEI